MAFVTRDGVRLYYDAHGSGPAVLLSHGYGATSQMWQDQVAALKDRYRVIVWDLRGHGESDYPCLLYTSPSPRDNRVSRMPSSA